MYIDITPEILASLATLVLEITHTTVDKVLKVCPLYGRPQILIRESLERIQV